MKCKILSFIIGLTVGEIVVSGTVTPAQAASFSQSTSTFSFFVYFEDNFGPVENGTITSKVAKQECSQQTSTVNVLTVLPLSMIILSLLPFLIYHMRFG